MNPRIYLLPLGAFAIGTGNFVFVGVLDALAEGLGIPVSTAGQLTTVFAVAYALSAPLLVAASARLPRRAVLATALALFTVANLLMAVVPAFAPLLGLRVIAAFGAAVYMPVAMGVAVELARPHERGRAMAIVLVGLTCAFLFGIPAGTWIGTLFGWQATFLFAAVIGALSLVVIVPTLPRMPGTGSRGLSGLGVVMRLEVVGLLAVSTLAFVAVFCINAFIGPVLARATGLGGTGIAMLQVLLGLGGVLGVPLGGWLADRGAGSGAAAIILLTIAAAQSVFSLLLLVPGWAETPGSILASGIALTLASGALFALGPIQQQRLILAADDERDIVLSLNAAALFLGQGIGAAIGGLSIVLLGFGANGFVGAVIAVVGTALLLHIGRLRARARAAAG